jgi:hypothetical protein
MKSGEMTDIPDQSSVTPAPMVDEGPLLFLCHVVAAILIMVALSWLSTTLRSYGTAAHSAGFDPKAWALGCRFISALIGIAIIVILWRTFVLGRYRDDCRGERQRFHHSG